MVIANWRMDDLRHFFYCILVRRIRHINAKACNIFCTGSALMPDNVQLVSIINEAIWVAFITNTEINYQRFFVGFRDVPVGISAGESADNIYSRQAIRTGYIFKP